MGTVIFDVTTLQDFLDRAHTAAASGQPACAARISFPTAQRLLYVLSSDRWAILQSMAGAGEMGLRELARRVGRDVRSVHADIAVLLDAGVIDRTEHGKLLFPYHHVKVQFALDDVSTPTVLPEVMQRSQHDAMRSIRQAATLPN